MFVLNASTNFFVPSKPILQPENTIKIPITNTINNVTNVGGLEPLHKSNSVRDELLVNTSAMHAAPELPIMLPNHCSDEDSILV